MSTETTNSRVAASIDNRYKVTSVARTHSAVCDEPIELGGTDEAMDPTELFLSALASCKLATMRMVAHRKGWNTTGMTISLEIQKEQDTNTILQTITFPDELTMEQRDRLTTISHKCPVAKIVTGELHILDTTE